MTEEEILAEGKRLEFGRIMGEKIPGRTNITGLASWNLIDNEEKIVKKRIRKFFKKHSLAEIALFFKWAEIKFQEEKNRREETKKKVESMSCGQILNELWGGGKKEKFPLTMLDYMGLKLTKKITK